MTTAAELTKPVWLNITATGVFSQERQKPIILRFMSEMDSFIWKYLLELEV